MRSLILLSSLVAATVSTTTNTRKSLSFGSRLHPTYNTSPISASSFNNGGLSALQVAEKYVEEILGYKKGSWKIREDSYEDKSTGVSHVFFRQLVLDGQVEVSDGDVNVNVFNGKVVSYGDSFYKGPEPDLTELPHTQEVAHDQAYFCAQLRDTIASQLVVEMSDQQPLSFVSPIHTHSNRLKEIYESNCLNLHFVEPVSIASDQLIPTTAKDAALYFVILSHPDETFARHLLSDFKAYSNQIEVEHEHALHAKPFPSSTLSNVPSTVSPVKASIAFMQTPNSGLTLVWRMELEMENNWYEAYVDVSNPTRVMTSIDWVSDYAAHYPEADSVEVEDHVAPVPKACWPHPPSSATKPKSTSPVYKIWPWGINDPSEGERDFVKGYDETASPIGWHAIPAAFNPSGEYGRNDDDLVKDDGTMCNFTTTWGNNVQAQENWEGRNGWYKNGRPEGNHNMTFVYKWGANYDKHKGEEVEPKGYIDLVVTQLFYTVNMVHDLYYRYGFDEVAGNFQNYNFGKGGKENDAVIANAQDGSGYNNANFATPPDGSRGKMRMYVWDTAKPFRDGDLEAGIVIHEFSHGLSTRITGGPANSGCLGFGESGGMGEGWGDFLATMIRSSETYQDYAMGAWAANREQGIRNYVYSLNMTTNPSTYKTLDGPGYWGVHAIGEVWAEILWVVAQQLIEKYGFSNTLFPPQPPYIFPNDFYNPPLADGSAPIPKHGNTLMIQLVLNGMKLQPCHPSFFAARDAIILADEILTGGENKCELWEGFSSRGLGPGASLRGGTPWGGGIRKNDFDLPTKCTPTQPEPAPEPTPTDD